MEAADSMDAAPKPKRRVAFAGADYIEYDAEAAPVVRRCGVGGLRQTRDDADVALEWSARGVAADGEEPTDAEQMRRRLEGEYAREMRETMAERGFPCVDESLVPLRVQLRASELLVAWSMVAPFADGGLVAAGTSLDEQRKRLELCRKHIFGPVVDGYAFGRRFFSIDSFLSLLELEELSELAQAHGIQVPELSDDVSASIKVADRELIAMYSPTGQGKPLKTLTFRELVEEAYARGIFMDDNDNGLRDARNKKSKRAWVDALRPVVHAEMRAYKIREAHTELVHAHLAAALEDKMQESRVADIVEIVRGYLQSDASSPTCPSSLQDGETAAVVRYFRALVDWYDAQAASGATTQAPKTVSPAAMPVVSSPSRSAL